jgi:hypothetical protein
MHNNASSGFVHGNKTIENAAPQMIHAKFCMSRSFLKFAIPPERLQFEHVSIASGKRHHTT